MPDSLDILNETVVPSVTETTPIPTIPAPPVMTNFAENIGAAVGIVVHSLANALSVILLQGGLVLVLLVAGLGFMFVMWAIRLIHLRGR